MELARRTGDIEIVAVDSMQVYRGMDIGTAKPSDADRAEVPHHMIDLADPWDEWSVTRWTGAARAAIEGIEERGRRPLLVGGTGLYLHALVDGFAPPGRFPEARAEVEAESDTGLLHRRLSELDPLAASRMEPTNRRRVTRALEVTIGSGQPFSSYGPGVGLRGPTTWRLTGLWLPRAVVAARVESRLAGMVRSGLVEEVRAILEAPEGLSRTARQALGYKEIAAHLEQAVPLEEALCQAVVRTRAFSRRQRMWWRRDNRIRWFGSDDNPLAVISQILGDWSTT
jgi:tRNA dimethylallyltransferase